MQINLADVDQDGTLDRKEFYRLMCKVRSKLGVSNVSDRVDGGEPYLLERDLEMAANAERYRWCPPPWFITLVTVAQVAFYIFHVFHFLAKEGGAIYPTWDGPYQFCSNVIFNPRRRREIWRFLSYVLVHAGYQHLLVNVFLQLLVGLPLEMSNGSLRVMTVYLSGALMGSLGVSTVLPRQYLVGASASVFALVGGHCASMILNWKEDRMVIRERLRRAYRYNLAGGGGGRGGKKLKQTRKSTKLRIVRLAFVLLLVGVDVGASFASECRSGKSACTTVEAHLGGFCAGLLVGVLVLRNRRAESWEVAARAVAGVLFFSAVLTTSTWQVLGDGVWMAAKNQTWFQPEKYVDLEVNCSYHD